VPERDRRRVEDLGSVVCVAPGDVLHESGGLIREVWFPIHCVLSVTASMRNGSEAEVAIIGSEGLAGVMALLGGTDTTWNEAAVQIGGQALRVPLDRMRQEVARSAALRLLLQRYGQALLVQTSQTAGCNRFHSIEQRLARCLLALHDRVEGDEIPMTHERLAIVLGSLRPGVTVAARRLQDHGVIHYTRGKITIVDRATLLATACECYEAVSSEYDRLLGAQALQQLSLAGEVPEETLREVNSRLLVAAIREQRAREQAEEANDVTTRFFATLSHELRSPLTAILGWSEILQTRELDDETLKVAIHTIRRNAEVQKQLVNDMVDLTRLRSGQMRLRLEPVDVTAAVRAAVASSRPAADVGSVAVTVIAGEPVTLDADPIRLQQILANLLTNAVKFTQPGGAVEVALQTTGSSVQISVRDNGRGIEPELLAHVFDDFRHGAAGRSGELGMGLGLAIVQQLVSLHGGSVRVQSAGAGRGATVTVVLPRGASGGGGGGRGRPADKSSRARERAPKRPTRPGNGGL
jgi:signal transduction histidine kinase